MLTKPLIVLDYDSATITVPSLSVSFRTLLGLAAEECKGKDFKRRWTVLYKGAQIGSVKLKNFT